MAHPAGIIEGKTTCVEGSRLGISSSFSFKFDKNGIPAIAYYDLDNNELKYAHVVKGRWAITSVAPASSTVKGVECSLDFDSQNIPHIAFFSGEKNLKLAFLSKNYWKIENVDNASNSGLHCYLVISDSGEPIISYRSSGGLMLARKIASSWKTEKIDSSGHDSIISISSSGKITIYYKALKETTGKVSSTFWKMATQEGFAWKSTAIPNTDNCAGFDVASGKNGAPVIAYIRNEKIYLYRETVPNSGIWKEESMENEDGSFVSLTVKENGFPTLCYTDRGGKELKIARFDGAKWDIKKVATARENYKFLNCEIITDKKDRDIIILHDGDTLNAFIQQMDRWRIGRIDGKVLVGGYIDLSLDKDKNPAMCYYDYTRRELHFASRNSEGKWNVELVDSLGDVGKYASLAFDTDGNPGISYYDRSRGDLKFAYKKNDRWFADRVDYAGDVGKESSLTFDEQGNPQIAYCDNTNGYIKFAKKTGKKWMSEKITPLGDYGSFPVVLSSPDTSARVIFVQGEKIKKVSPGESPVRTYLKIAERVGEGSWKINTLLGPYAVDINSSSLCADISTSGNIAVAFIDREGKLRVMLFQDKDWKNMEVAPICWGNVSIKFNSDGTLGVLYATGRSRQDSELHFSRYDGSKWNEFRINFPQEKIQFVSLGDSPAGKLQFAYSDSRFFFAMYFEEK